MSDHVAKSFKFLYKLTRSLHCIADELSRAGVKLSNIDIPIVLVKLGIIRQ